MVLLLFLSWIPKTFPVNLFTMSDDENKNIFSIMCRLCLSQNMKLLSLYPSCEFDSNLSSSKMFTIIERFTTVKMRHLDNLPQKICSSCIQTIQSMLAFQTKCKQNEVLLQKMTENLKESGSLGVLDDVKQELNDLDESGPLHDESNNSVESENVDEPENSSMHQDETRSLDEVKIESMNSTELGNDESEIDTKEILEVGVDDTKKEKRKKANFSRPNSNKQKTDKRDKPKRAMLTCDICGKLAGKYELQYHINRHNGVKPFKCDVDNCASRFADPRDVLIHKKSMHFSKRGFSCDICGAGFKFNQALLSHRRRHFDPKIPCTICGKLFKSDTALKKHMLVHSQDRQFKCETCGKAFQTRYTLRVHKRVHTQEKPYSCHCGVSFAYKCLLTAHDKKYHQ